MAEDLDKDNLLYRPEYTHEEDYMSDSDFVHSPQTPLTIPDTPEMPKAYDPRVISNDLQEIIDLFPALPEPLQFYKPTIEKIKQRLDIIYPEGSDPKTYPDYPRHKEEGPEAKKNPPVVSTIPTDHIHITEAPPNLPSLFPDPPPLIINVQPPQSVVEIVKADYAKDQIHLDTYYTQRLQLIVQKYFQSMLASMADCGISDIDDMTREFDGDSVKIPAGQGLEHLRDHIVRSQIIRGQKERFFKKSHSVDKTLLHMRAWHAAEKARERYYQESYGDSGSYAESHSNALLREARAGYDSAYASSLYSMYRYLDSSTSIMNDTLEMTAKEAQAKAMLVKKGVNIFETDETDAVGDAQAALEQQSGSLASENAKAPTEIKTTTDENSAARDSATEDGSDTGASKESSSSGFMSTVPPLSTMPDPKGAAIGGGIFGGLFGGDTSDTTKYGPNGKKYETNDIDYLAGQGYTKEQAIDILSKDEKYTTPYKGPNGREYSENDVNYLVNQGYSKEDAYATLAKDDKYNRKRPWDELGKAVANQADSMVSNIVNGTINSVNDVISGKTNIKDLGKAIVSNATNSLHQFTSGTVDTVKQQATSYVTDWTQKTINKAIDTYNDANKKAPNGKTYSKNDVKYLMDRGYSRDEAYEILSKEPKYTLPYKGPNGKKYSQNDIDYLTNQGYTIDQAYEMLAKSDKYAKK